MVFIEIEKPIPQPDTSRPVKILALVASIAAAVQYGWALQLSLLTPYIQLLGVPHKCAAFVWLGGPISGLLVQPTVGCYSDRCTSRFGRRRPFIFSGGVLFSIAVLLIGFAADIGRCFGDTLRTGTKSRAVTVFVIGFWVLDIGNNMIQGPCRAFLADLSGENVAKITISNALFAFFMAIGNVIGYGTGSYMQLHRILPFTKTQACDIYCADLKTTCLFSAIFMVITTTLVVSLVKEERLDPLLLAKEDAINGEVSPSLYSQLLYAIINLSKPMKILLLVTCLNWIGWFPFLFYSTDWMGKEVYGGNVTGTNVEISLYDQGVRAGSLGLMFYVVSLALVSLFMDPIIKLLGNVKRFWGIANFILAICMALTAVITKMAADARMAAAARGRGHVPPPVEVMTSSLSLFAVLGIPQAVTYSIPFSLASIFTNNCGTGQGLALGVLNLSIVFPQIFVALVAGPVDSLFGSSNLPAFLIGGVGATLSGILALTMLPA